MTKLKTVPFAQRDIPTLPQFQLLLTDLLPQFGKPTVELACGDLPSPLLTTTANECDEAAQRITRLIGDIALLQSLAVSDHSIPTSATLESVGHGLALLVDLHQALTSVSEHCEVGK